MTVREANKRDADSRNYRFPKSTPLIPGVYQNALSTDF
jgi:hypothetical protein|tara:strand:+ start:239 stop:352 length:114 start_codon:yes stop_codon:yes gene_type:complete